MTRRASYAVIRRALMEAPATARELARRLGVPARAMSLAVAELKRSGQAVTIGTDDRDTRGRPAHIVDLTPRGRWLARGGK